MRRLFALTLLLPLAGLAAGIAANEVSLAGADEWRIPIAGYDPRDPVRGQYIDYAYDWTLAGDPEQCAAPEGCIICLEGPPPDGRRGAIRPGSAECPYAVRDIDEDVRFVQGPERQNRLVLRGRIFMDGERAARWERQLREEPMVVVAKLTAGGRLMPLRLDTRQGEKNR
ncbi:hypothetical protein B5C34_01185 [Pacificimonas flava]|uniref:GDYXXLXY domain-containing protein n=2 Tax=Pacificimonas TaxID=1960290 RepID=A0A219B301_9SPHN|nr:MULTISPECIES: GDYXXLXY domain-containing protein [Pacificimonas]MBZ6378171.1 GDYXXLXY domain-containing protein [Pacificimonas aurantium]OWV32199.1 hypothetical protein B5C34_01185 [Pacificimonas flava]